MRKSLTILLLLACAQASFGQLSGALSGTLGPGTYHVIDTIRVNSGYSLRLMPATTFIFDGPYPFKIYGTLLAEGTLTDSIVFTTEQSDTSRWRGLRFTGSASSGSRLAHCIIEEGYATGGWPDYVGGGMFLDHSSPSLANCTVRGNSANYGGGGLFCYYSSPTFTNCTISANAANSYGGGMDCWDYSSPTFTNCVVSGNSAAQGGGVHYFNHSSPTFLNCTFSGNSATWGGGGFCEGYPPSPTFTNCTFSANSASNGGGGVYCSDSSTFTNCTFSGNSASDAGGGVCCRSRASFTNCSFSGNSASSGGGSYCEYSSTFTICTFSANSATWGGGVFCHGYPSSQTFTNCTMGGNSASIDGGGVYCHSSSPTLANCTVRGNSASEHGGGVFCYSSSPTFANCTLTVNSAALGGGVHCYSSSSPTLTNCTVSGNSASNDGGGVYCYFSSSPIIANCTVSCNSANDDGGGLYCSGSSPTFANCTFSGNLASDDGGGVWSYGYGGSPIFNSTIIAFSIGSGVYFYNSAGSQIEYCVIFDNSGGNFDFYNNNSSNGPPGIGQLIGTNVNGDSCDVYHNILLNPMFVDTSVDNYHLMWTECDDAFDSPCIDAGDPSILDDSLDCDFGLGDSLCDIGRYGGNATAPSGVLRPDHPMIPTSVVLFQNYPNPFNTTTVIRYDVPQVNKVSLTIFNLLGQEVARLVDGRQLAGTYAIAWNAGNLPSGVYLCRMEAGRFVQTRKVVLVK